MSNINKEKNNKEKIQPKLQVIYSQQSSRIKSLAFSSTQPIVALSTLSGQVILFNYQVKQVINTFQAHNSPVRALQIHPTLPLLVTGADDKIIKLWNLENMQKVKLVGTFTGHKDFIRSVSFAHSQPYIASASDDYTIKIFNFQAKKEMCDFVGHKDFVMSLQFSFDDQFLFTCSLDKTVKVFSIKQMIDKVKNLKENKNIYKQALNYVLGQQLSPICTTGILSSPLNSISLSTSQKSILYTVDDDGILTTYKFNPGKNLLDSMIYDVDTKRVQCNGSNCVTNIKNYVIMGGNDSKIRFYDEKDRQQIFEIDLNEYLKKQPAFQDVNFIEQNRIWCIQMNENDGIIAVGLDLGFCLIKIQQYGINSKNYSIVDEGILNIQDNNVIFNHNDEISKWNKPINQLIKPIDLLCIGDPFPLLVGYKTTNKYIYFTFLTSQAKNGLNSFYSDTIISHIDSNILYTQGKTLNCYQANFGGLQQKYEIQFSNKILAIGYTGKDILVQLQDKTVIIDQESKEEIAQLNIHQTINKVLFNNEIYVIITDNYIYIYNKENNQLLHQHKEYTTITSSIISDSNCNLMIYTTETHCQYIHLTKYLTGYLTSINSPVFIAQHKNDSIIFTTNTTKVIKSKFSDEITNLLIKSADNKMGDVAEILRKMKKSNLHQEAVIKRLLDANQVTTAVQMLKGNQNQSLRSYVEIKQHLPVKYEKGMDKKQIQENSLINLQIEELYKCSSPMEQAVLNNILESDNQIIPDTNIHENLISYLMNHENEAIKNFLIEQKMFGAAKVLCKNYELNDDIELNDDNKQYINEDNFEISNKKLTFTNRKNKLHNYEFQKIEEEIVNEPEEIATPIIEEKQKEEKPVNQEWQENSSSSEKSEEKENVKNNDWQDESSSSESTTDIFNINSQEMKQLGINNKSVFAQQQLQTLQGKEQDLPFTLATLQQNIQQAMNLFTDAEFEKCQQILLETMFNSKILQITGQSTEKQIQIPFQTCIEYLQLLKFEINRRLNNDQLTQIEMANYILCEAALAANNTLIQPQHKVLVLKLMMQKMKKIDYRSSQIIATELIRNTKDSEIIQKAEKILQKVSSEKCQELIQFQSLKEIKADFNTLKAVHINESSQFHCCTYCESLSMNSDELCSICQCGIYE